MLIFEKRKSKKKQKELGGGANLRRTFSNTSAPTKVQINIENAKEKLSKLLEVSVPCPFLKWVDSVWYGYWLLFTLYLDGVD